METICLSVYASFSSWLTWGQDRTKTNAQDRDAGNTLSRIAAADPIPSDSAVGISRGVWQHSSMSVTLEIPDDVLAAMPVAEQERNGYLLLEIACALYARDVLSLGKAAELAGMPKITFGQEIGRRGIARHYTDAELEADLAYGRGE